MTRALKGLRKYQEAPRTRPQPLMPAIADRAGATIRDYGGEGPPVLFVPSLINPPNILDLGARRSLLRWLSGQGRRVLLLDWGWPVEVRRNLDIKGHVEQVLVPLLDDIGETCDLVGYCLGGTMAIAAAATAPVRSLATIAAPWTFSRYPVAARDQLGRLWANSRPAVDALELMPMEILQSAFWSLDPERTIAKFEAFADLEGVEAEIFVALEDWANDGAPISRASATELFEDFFRDDLPGEGRWQVAGAVVDGRRSIVPTLNMVSTSDRIVPFETAPDGGERLEFAQGHVGMVVGSSARDRLWKALAQWLGRTL